MGIRGRMHRASLELWPALLSVLLWADWTGPARIPGASLLVEYGRCPRSQDTRWVLAFGKTDGVTRAIQRGLQRYRLLLGLVAALHTTSYP